MSYKYIPLYFFTAAMLGFTSMAQGQSELRKANRHYENYEFALALKQYNKVLEKREADLYLAQRIAESYRLTRNSQQAESWYEKVVKMEGRGPMHIYFYAEALRRNGKYEEAKEQYMLWGEELPEKADLAQELIKSCDMAMLWMSKLAVADVKPLKELNDANCSDFSPIQYGDDIVFSSDRGTSSTNKKSKIYGWTGRPYLQLFSVKQDNEGSWSKPVALQDKINSKYHNATATAANDERTLFFTRTHMVKLKEGSTDPTSWVKEAEAKEYVNRLEIYFAEKQDGTWSNIKPFVFNKVKEYSVGHPALSPDGKILYFASDMPGGMGATDIYYTIRQDDGSWGNPINAGAIINTPGRESFPYVDKNGKLFFASDGHLGMGGLDIFEAEGTHATWSAVQNIGYPINSSKNDYGIMFTEAGATGMFSSNRGSDNGTDDIFSFKMLQKPVVLAITTLERKQNKQKRSIQVPLPQVQIVAAQEHTNDSVVVTSSKEGKYFLDGRKGNTYSFNGFKKGYLNQSAKIQVPATAGDTVQVALLFDKNELNKAIVLENIYYDLDKWDIRPDAAKELDKLVNLLKRNPGIRIEMGSHTDSRESYGYNQILSDKRAQAAVDYLISKGIKRSRLIAKGYGKTRLLNRCADGVPCSEAEHQRNRRTEFKIIR